MAGSTFYCISIDYKKVELPLHNSRWQKMIVEQLSESNFDIFFSDQIFTKLWRILN